MYDPDRSQTLTEGGIPSAWPTFVQALRNVLSKPDVRLRVLTETITSPTLMAQLQRLLKKFPQAKWHQYDPLHANNAHDGSVLAFGRAVHTHYNLAPADVIVCL